MNAQRLRKSWDGIEEGNKDALVCRKIFKAQARRCRKWLYFCVGKWCRRERAGCWSLWLTQLAIMYISALIVSIGAVTRLKQTNG